MIKYLLAHRNDDVRTLALHSVPENVDRALALQMIAGYQVARRKLPAWAATWDESNGTDERRMVRFAPRLSMEQCSSQEAAEYKCRLVRRLLAMGNDESRCQGEFVDLTGGLGVDCSFMARLFAKARYVERQEHLCELARHNMRALGLTNVEVVCGEAESVLEGLPRQCLIYLDPARRDAVGRKVFMTADCQPDVVSMHDALVSKADIVLVKLSPMLDIHDALRSLPSTSEVHVVEVRGEVKELLIVMQSEACLSADRARITLDDVPIVVGDVRFSYGEEAGHEVQYADAIERYLYEPSPGLMKAGAYRTVAARYGLKKLHRDSHLYTAAHRVSNFAGRVLEVEGWGLMRDVRQVVGDVRQANIVCRNFPQKPDELRRRLKIKDGGDRFVYGTTIDTRHVIIRARSF